MREVCDVTRAGVTQCSPSSRVGTGDGERCVTLVRASEHVAELFLFFLSVKHDGLQILHCCSGILM